MIADADHPPRATDSQGLPAASPSSKGVNLNGEDKGEPHAANLQPPRESEIRPEDAARPETRLSFLDWLMVRFYAPKHTSLLLQFPGGLFDHWKRTARDEFPLLPLSRRAFVDFSAGLVDFFSAVSTAKDRCMLPSKGVDSIWHAWMQFDNAHLEAFCTRHFKAPVPHIEVKDFSKLLSTEKGLAYAWVETCKYEGIDLRTMPTLFRQDRDHHVAFGYWYTMQPDGFVVHHPMDERGRPDLSKPAFVHMGLTAKSFLDLGLVDRAQAASITGQPIDAMDQPVFLGFKLLD